MKRLPLPWLVSAGAVLALAGALAVTAAWEDSLTVDEPAHLVSGAAVLLKGDFRLSPDHPPLGRSWAALPVLFVSQRWPGDDAPGWREGDYYRFGEHWLSDLNDGLAVARPARLMVIALFLAVVAATACCAGAIFGRPAALLALALAALDPLLLGFGHLAMLDVPATAACLAALVSFRAYLAAPSGLRLGLFAAATSAAFLVKHSAVLLLPAIGVLALLSLRSRGDVPPAPLGGRLRAAAVGLAVVAFAVPAAIWAAYGFRYSPFRGPDAASARMYAGLDADGRSPADMEVAWRLALNDPATGQPRSGVATAALSFARAHRLLPEAYLYGAAYAEKKALYRGSYLRGRYSLTGFPEYFPVAFAVKVPLATLLLALGGIAALLARRARPRDPLLFWGLVAFAAVYWGAALSSRLNIGVRHLLPAAPVLFVVASASTAWLSTRAGRWGVGAAVVWLAGATVANHPHHEAYFNELSGGRAAGHRWLLDSNMDLGQDHLRLQRWAARHPSERIVLARYFDTLLPRGFRPELFLPGGPGQPLAPLGAGTYVVSLNELHGLYRPPVRDDAWRDVRFAGWFRELAARLSSPLPEDASPEALRRRDVDETAYDQLRRARLLNRLKGRPPDERIGASLLAFRLSEADVERLSAP